MREVMQGELQMGQISTRSHEKGGVMAGGGEAQQKRSLV